MIESRKEFTLEEASSMEDSDYLEHKPNGFVKCLVSSVNGQAIGENTRFFSVYFKENLIQSFVHYCQTKNSGKIIILLGLGELGLHYMLYSSVEKFSNDLFLSKKGE